MTTTCPHCGREDMPANCTSDDCPSHEQNKSPPPHIPLDAQHYNLLEQSSTLRTTNAELLESLAWALDVIEYNMLKVEGEEKTKALAAIAKARGWQ